MEWVLIVVLALWNTYITLTLWHNSRQDRRGDIIDKSTVMILKIHCRRLDRLEHELHLGPIDSEDTLFKKEEEDGRGDS